MLNVLSKLYLWVVSDCCCCRRQTFVAVSFQTKTANNKYSRKKYHRTCLPTKPLLKVKSFMLEEFFKSHTKTSIQKL